MNFIPILLAGISICPINTVRVPNTNTCIDRYEWPNTKGTLPSIGMSAIVSNFDSKRGIVADAERSCASVGKRVCQYDEWKTSCEGPKRSKYPFGPKLPRIQKADDAPCNYAEFFTAPDRTKIYYRDPHEFARLDKRDPSGERGCVSASGAEDMMGNVEEWVKCPPFMSLSKNNCTKNKNGSIKACYCLMGRYWAAPYSCDYAIAGHSPQWYDYQTGFRCCKTARKVPITSTISMREILRSEFSINDYVFPLLHLGRGHRIPY